MAAGLTLLRVGHCRNEKHGRRRAEFQLVRRGMTAAGSTAMTEVDRPTITCEHGVWIVRVGNQQEYRCASEEQARQLKQSLERQPG